MIFLLCLLRYFNIKKIFIASNGLIFKISISSEISFLVNSVSPLIFLYIAVLLIFISLATLGIVLPLSTINDFNKLNDLGKKNVLNYTNDLTHMSKYKIYDEPSHLMPIASHDKDGDCTE